MCKSLRSLRCLGTVALLATMGHASLYGAPDDRPHPQVRTRRDIMSLAPDGPEIAAFRRAVAVLKSRPATDPTSWEFQGNIHATKDPSNPGVWNQCQHGNYFFLPWHRMYTYWLERILRDASGDPEFTLPYWNYVSPAARALPEPFRLPADATNPLFVSERNPEAGGVNHGARLPASAAATFWLPFRLTNFSTTVPTGFAFGGRTVDRPVHLMPTMGSFESYHNVMHVLIGGENGYMSDPTTAARDPIFLMHHVNVDRLWNRWLDQGGGRANPVDDPTWMNTRFKFFNEKGQPVEMAVRDVLEPEELGYRYDDDPPPSARPGRDPTAPGKPLRPLASSKSESLDLGTDGPVRVTIHLGDEARAAARAGATLALFIEGIHFEKEPMVYYEVYVNLPADAAPDFQSVHYAGNLVFAGLGPPSPHGQHASHGMSHADETDLGTIRALDITDVVRELRARKLWDDARLTVTFVMQGLIPVGNAPVTRPGIKAHFAKVTFKAN